MKNKLLSLLVAVIMVVTGCDNRRHLTADYHVVPLPDSVKMSDSEFFTVSDDTPVVYAGSDSAMIENANFLAEYIKQLTGLELKVSSTQTDNAIVLKADLKSDNPEAYELTVDGSGIMINGASPAGTFYGIQTLRKSLKEKGEADVDFPFGQVVDSPRFPYRGAMFDVCRYFFSVDEVKRFIDLMAMHNMNRFHWHLNDDQGWRIEIKSRPRLTAVGSMRSETVIGHNTPEFDGRPHGGYYTHDEIREIVDYARRRHIEVIPEIDMPGHMQAALAAYPELGCTGGPYEVWKIFGVSEEVLCAGNDSTYAFLEDVFSEITDLFPSEVIHVGGDECPKRNWEKCRKCQAKIKSLGLKTDSHSTAENKLQTYVTSHVEKFLQKRGRRIMGWDEILEGGLTDNATVMSWRGTDGGLTAARSNHDVVMAPTDYCYLDYFQSEDVENEPDAFGGLITVEKAYSFEPVPTELEPEFQRHILGVQANLWTTYIPDFDLAEYMLLPRLAALSEVQWTKPEKKDLKDFSVRLKQLQKHYDAAGYRYARHLYDVKPTVACNRSDRTVEVGLETVDGSPVRYTLDGSEPGPGSELYTQPVVIDKTSELKAKAFPENGESSAVYSEKFQLHKGVMLPIDLKCDPVERYRYGGASTLSDGQTGTAAFQSGRWIGFFDSDMDAVIKFPKPTELSSVSVNSCVAKNDWIFDMRRLTVSVSDDGKEFTEVATAEYPKITAASPNGVYPHELEFTPVKTNFVRVVAESEREPEGVEVHGKGYLLVDEIVIN